MAWTTRPSAMMQQRHRAAAPCGRSMPQRVHAAAPVSSRARARTVVVRALTITNEQVVLSTPTGKMTCQVYRPTAPGRYPGLLLFSEIFQITEPIARSSRIMASHGFVVLTPEIYHEYLEPGVALSYADPKGADKGNELKITKPCSAYDSDSAECVKWLMNSQFTTGKIGVMGFCIGGHLAYRGSLNKGVLAGACIYPTDIHKAGLGKGGDNSLLRAPEFAANGTELMFIWGRQDPHVPRDGRVKIQDRLESAGVNFTWHEYNGQHAFMRDEGPRYDAELALEVYGKLTAFFRRKLSDGSLPPAKEAGGPKESKH